MDTALISARVITCSDSAARGERVDASGPAVRELLERNGCEVDRIDVVPDALIEISDAIASAIDIGRRRLVVTTGGTGVAPRDVTPEATLRIADRRIDGFGELMRLRSLDKTPLAALSRAQAATRGDALIINVPGSPKGAVENLEAVIHLVAHTLSLLGGGRVDDHPGSFRVSRKRVVTGLEALLDEPASIVGRRIGLVTNHAAVTSDFRHALPLLAGDSRWKLVSLFGPEHGIWGEAQDMAHVGHSTDPLTRLDVRSLYGATFDELSPNEGDLDGLDTLVVDLQDVGSRYYTFVYTMALCMRVAARKGVRVVVLDRPNPLGGLAVEGNILALEYASFVGMYPLPVRHGMTAGELALYFAAYDRLDLDLHVVPMRGWTRSMWWSDTGLPWVLPSPNMPTPDTATVYPGMCLVEGTTLSEGRGTTRPFEIWGAPWLDPFELAADLSSLELPGVAFRPHFFKPTFQKHAGAVCGGVQIHVTDRDRFEPYRTGLFCIKVAHDCDPDSFEWRREAYEFVTEHPAIDLLTGDPSYRVIIDEEGDLDAWIREGSGDARAFAARRIEWLLYE